MAHTPTCHPNKERQIERESSILMPEGGAKAYRAHSFSISFIIFDIWQRLLEFLINAKVKNDPYAKLL